MIFLENKRASKTLLLQKFPNSLFFDVTSKSKDGYIKFSPFFPHGKIPVPFSDMLSFSVEGVWQGLKIFENEDIDFSKFSIETMKNIKRGGTKLGKVLGHRKGIDSTEILDYLTARRLIYIPTYKFILENYLSNEIDSLTILSQNNDIVLLDYNTNRNIENLHTPLSHASIIIDYILNL